MTWLGVLSKWSYAQKVMVSIAAVLFGASIAIEIGEAKLHAS